MKIIIFFLSFILFLSCKSEPINKVICINPELFLNKQLKLSEYADEIKYVKLSSEIIFGKIYHIELSDNYIFIATDQDLLAYNHEGNFIRKIGGKGNGPMEYSHCIDFTVDITNEIIYIRDFPNIKSFSFNGEYLGSIKLSESHVKTIYADESLYLFPLLIASEHPTEYLWKRIDLNGNTIDSKKNNDIRFEGEGLTYRSNHAYKASKFIGYWNQYSDTIYKIGNDTISTSFVWTKGNYRLTTSKNINDDDISSLVLYTVFETNNLLYMQYSKEKRIYICIYNKETRQFIYQEMEGKMGIKNDIDNGIAFSPQYLSLIDGSEYFIQSVYPDILIDHNYKTENSIINQLSSDDNHVLIFVKLKTTSK